MRSSYKNIIFDLDGTLVDSFPGIEESLKYAISVVDPVLDLSQLRSYIGPPLSKMLARMWPQKDEVIVNQVIHEFRSDYIKRGCFCSRPFSGVSDLLLQLRSKNYSLFVLTNKPADPARKILQHLGWEKHFTEVLSPDAVTPCLTTKTEGAHLLVQKHSLIAAETILVGDSQDDVTAAQSAGFTFLEASYGYGLCDENVTKRTWLQLKSPMDLVSILA